MSSYYYNKKYEYINNSTFIDYTINISNDLVGPTGSHGPVGIAGATGPPPTNITDVEYTHYIYPDD